ncbi:MAG: DUF4038 domain-containing protein [Propionibacteriaceae bacterium]
MTAVSADGHYFVDQYGQPLLIRGDSPWSLLTDLSPDEAADYLADRQRLGFNSVIVSLLGSVGNGGPSDDGSTFDGLTPFEGQGITHLSARYWQRAHDYLKLAADHGITVFLYPIDAWIVGRSFRPQDISECGDYGTQVAHLFADLPNIVWLAGGDYRPDARPLSRGSDVDHCVDAMMRGIRSTGDNRPFSIQLGFVGANVTTEDPFWRSRVDWNFVYTYFPTYNAVLAARASAPRSLPVVLGEANYERENNQPTTPATTNATLRRQVMWALTCGASGDFYGSSDWSFPAGWSSRLDSTGAREVNRLRDLVAGLAWWKLVPDVGGAFISAGRGKPVAPDAELDVLDSDLATAALASDGSFALIYVPTSRTLKLDLSRLRGAKEATWIDPSTGARTRAAPTSSYQTPGLNHDGDEDWILLLSPRR